MSSELLSICIPTYNRSRLLGQILEVLGAQIRAAGAENVVLYISDNGSPDNTRQVVGEFQKQSGVRVVYSRNDTNLGISKNLLKVMAMGKGRFVWTLGRNNQEAAQLLCLHIDLDPFRYSQHFPCVRGMT